MVLPFSSLGDFQIKLKPEHETFRRVIREFAEREVAPRIGEMEKAKSIPWDLHEKCASQGFFGVEIPLEFDGQGGDNIMLMIMVEEVAKVYPALSTYLMLHGLFTYPILKYGTEEQKKRYVPPVARGEKLVAHASTEASGGSDPAGMQAVAKKEDDYWVLTGRKTFISAGDIADYYLVPARTSPPPDKRERWKGLTCFIVERSWPGISASRMEMMGLTASPTAEVVFEGVKIPDGNVVGKEGEGFKILMDTYDHGRMCVAAQALGVAQTAFEKSINYAFQRILFEKPIISFQAIQFYLADMFIELMASRLLVYWMAYLADLGKPEAVFATSTAKSYVTEAAERAALKAMNIHGGYGVATENRIDMLLRDVEIMKIYEGTNDIQRLTILRQVARKIFSRDIR